MIVLVLLVSKRASEEVLFSFVTSIANLCNSCYRLPFFTNVHL